MAMLTTVSQKTTNHHRNIAFGCKYCDKVSDVLIKCGADSKKVERYLKIILPMENKYKTAKLTKHEHAALKIYERIGSLKWGITPLLKKILEATSFMKT